jgi:nuclear pore complex protein Nup62
MQLTKVVKVLNSQLSQLQLIDSGASQLQEKIKQAQNESQRTGTNGWNGLGTDPSDDFYRSFRGGRTERFGGVS